jgi:hypothetical protein
MLQIESPPTRHRHLPLTIARRLKGSSRHRHQASVAPPHLPLTIARADYRRLVAARKATAGQFQPGRRAAVAGGKVRRAVVAAGEVQRR